MTLQQMELDSIVIFPTFFTPQFEVCKGCGEQCEDIEVTFEGNTYCSDECRHWLWGDQHE
ncbi:MAG: hypothetical protein R3267_11865 [Paenisporosarcina sp.]|nr:hypothetical protein [Paenisporosarcina sp.]